MSISFRKISELMDPVTPPSLRELPTRYRWRQGVPDLSIISFRNIASRHIHPQTLNLRFLSYNTYLLNILNVPLNTFDLAVVLAKIADRLGNEYDPMNILKSSFSKSGLASILGVNPIDIITLRYSVKDLANLLGVDLVWLKAALAVGTGGTSVVLDAVGVDVTDISIANVLDAAKKTPLIVLDTLDKVGFGDILVVAGLDPIGALAKASIGIADILGADIPDPIEIPPKPALEERAFEIGAELVASNYDLMALCEVFPDVARNNIESAFQANSRQYQIAQGQRDPAALQNGGLCCISVNRPIVATDSIVFDNRGDVIADADAYASKGVLLSVIDVGIGFIDLYSTHLYSGDGLLDFLPKYGLEKLPEPEKRHFRNAQLDEFIAFFKKTHNPNHVAIFTGDLNIPANDKDAEAYSALINRMMSIGLEDLWFNQRGIEVGTHDGADGLNRFSAICTPDSKDNRYCHDPTENTDTDRIDYIFVETPRLEHDFELDITRLRRRPFRRNQTTKKQSYLSDHLGLDTTLIVSPAEATR